MNDELKNAIKILREECDSQHDCKECSFYDVNEDGGSMCLICKEQGVGSLSELLSIL